MATPAEKVPKNPTPKSPYPEGGQEHGGRADSDAHFWEDGKQISENIPENAPPKTPYPEGALIEPYDDESSSSLIQGKSLERTERGDGAEPRNPDSDTLGPPPDQAPQNSQSAQDCPAVAQGSAAAEEEGATMCTACGHSVQSTLCCKMASQSTRAGERQRQAANRAKRQRELLVEEASRRPRVIPSVEEAVGPAQIAMARLKARLNKRVG